MPGRFRRVLAFTFGFPAAAALLALALPSGADAACCRLVKVDPETPSTQVRACEPNAQGGCGAILFEGTLATGASQDVCPTTPTVVYSEWDATAGAYAPPVTARCDAGGEIEL